MTDGAYYNEIDPYAAEWLRNLIAAGHIAPGDVDERDIRDIQPSDLDGYTQCHFFAGIGVWSHALRRAGFPDDRRVWSGSCPCQPFSAAGKKCGTADERHLWPAFFHLIDFWRPPIVLGERVASKDGLGWLDLVSADMEGAGYAFRAADLCAAGVGAPHIRQRLWFVGASHTPRGGWGEERAHGRGRVVGDASQGLAAGHSSSSSIGRLDDHHHQGSQGHAGDDGAAGRPGSERPVAEAGLPCGMADGDGWHAGAERQQRGGEHGQQSQDGGAARLEQSGCGGRERRQEATSGHVDDGQASERQQGQYGIGESGSHRLREDSPGPTNGFWRNADWLLCRDERWRPVESGTFPLVNGTPARVGRLRAYGNAIVAELAATFIATVLDALDDRVSVAPARCVNELIG